ncbi:D-alanyl-D-alanine carboxypeptidase [Alkalihalobacillus oceani]|uniref:serine hydrolase n=1 Tax=Halalkalibacter oceani TaxID=1653776 RepID=UPI002040430C|nr:D-alanyl-D-alanine carboxypeptidase [Halalkalibacter oceani]
MRLRFKKSFTMAVLVLVITNVLITSPVSVSANPNIDTNSAILVDATSGKILFQKNINELLKVASMSKMMSEYLVLEAIKNGAISWEQVVPISDLVREISHNNNLSNVYLRQDETYTVKELYESVAIYSANGATMALAELIAGSEESFVNMMNDKSMQLELGEYGVDYKFVNSTGLPNQYLLGKHPEGTTENDENELTVRATAKLAFHLLKDYPEVLETASIERNIFKEGTEDFIQMDNWNWMLPGLVYGYPDVDGLKTGYTAQAGYSFTGTAERDNVRLITVVTKTSSLEERFSETKKLLDYGFSQFSIEELIPKGYRPEGQETVGVSKGKEHEVAVITDESLISFVRVGERDKYIPVVTFDQERLNENGELIAPVEKGEKIGTISLEYVGENDYEFIDSNYIAQVDVITNEAIEEAGFFSLVLRSVGGFFSELWVTLYNTIKGWF